MATIKVKATQLGFYNGCRIRKDAVFSVDEKQFSKKWMERQPDETATTVKVPVKKLATDAAKKTLSLGNKSLV